MFREDVEEDLRQLAPQCIVTVRDDSIGLLGHVVIDSSIEGRACGGLRITDDLTVEQIAALAHGMTLKYGFNGMAQGGAKAGIVGSTDLPRERKQELLKRFGEIIAPLLRSQAYISGPDMGTSNEDIGMMLASAHCAIPKPRRHRGLKSGRYTALGVMVAVEACAEANRTSLRGLSAAIEGFGAVGGNLADLLVKRHGISVVAVSTTQGAIYNPKGLDIDHLNRLRALHGSECVTAYEGADRMPLEELNLLEVDVLAPCAGQFSITTANAHKLRASMVVPGANNPVTSQADQILYNRGILSVPYFAANCGGVLGNKAEVLGITEDAIEAFLRRKNRGRLVSLIEESRTRGIRMMPIAEAYAMRRFARIHKARSVKTPASTVGKLALRSFNAGLIPGIVVRPLAPVYLDRVMLNDPPMGGRH